MKISELIDKLTAVRQSHGDLRIFSDNHGDGCFYAVTDHFPEPQTVTKRTYAGDAWHCDSGNCRLGYIVASDESEVPSAGETILLL